jgi:hypothetical protein
MCLWFDIGFCVDGVGAEGEATTILSNGTEEVRETNDEDEESADCNR